MTLETLQQNWALLSAAAIALVTSPLIAFRIYEDSSRGRLGAAVRVLSKREKGVAKAEKAERKALSRVERLHAKVESVKPRHLEEAKGRLEDARTLKKIATDQALVARNQVRMVILEDYPPNQQEALRNKYLPQLND